MENSFIEKSHGAAISYFMRKNKLSQTRLSELTGVPRLTINRIINGKCQLTLKNLIDILDVLGVSIQQYVKRLKKASLKIKMVVSND